MQAKGVQKTAVRVRHTSKRGAPVEVLPSVEAAKLRLSRSKGLFATDAEREAFMTYDGPELAGPKEYRKP